MSLTATAIQQLKPRCVKDRHDPPVPGSFRSRGSPIDSAPAAARRLFVAVACQGPRHGRASVDDNMAPQRGACASIPGHDIRSLVAVICDNYLMEVANLAMVCTKLQKRSLNQLTISLSVRFARRVVTILHLDEIQTA
jgi:hypothetical protein